jgi:hypothetical protein
MDTLEKYRAEVLKLPVDADVIKRLNQPERYILVSYKVYKALLARIERLEEVQVQQATGQPITSSWVADKHGHEEQGNEPLPR